MNWKKKICVYSPLILAFFLIQSNTLFAHAPDPEGPPDEAPPSSVDEATSILIATLAELAEGTEGIEDLSTLVMQLDGETFAERERARILITYFYLSDPIAGFVPIFGPESDERRRNSLFFLGQMFHAQTVNFEHWRRIQNLLEFPTDAAFQDMLISILSLRHDELLALKMVIPKMDDALTEFRAKEPLRTEWRTLRDKPIRCLDFPAIPAEVAEKVRKNLAASWYVQASAELARFLATKGFDARAEGIQTFGKNGTRAAILRVTRKNTAFELRPFSLALYLDLDLAKRMGGAPFLHYGVIEPDDTALPIALIGFTANVPKWQTVLDQNGIVGLPFRFAPLEYVAGAQLDRTTRFVLQYPTSIYRYAPTPEAKDLYHHAPVAEDLVREFVAFLKGFTLTLSFQPADEQKAALQTEMANRWGLLFEFHRDTFLDESIEEEELVPAPTPTVPEVVLENDLISTEVLEVPDCQAFVDQVNELLPAGVE